MNSPFKTSRRRFITHTGLGLLAAVATPSWLQAMESDMSASGATVSRRANPAFNPDVEIDLTAGLDEIAILSGQKTRVMRYTGKLVKGPQGSVVDIPGSYLGPIIRLQKGQKVRINLHNKLPEPHITHWHGLHVPAEQDGHPMAAVDGGQSYVYEFEVLNRAGFHIYHPHAHEATATQVYYGLAGGIIVNDDEEARLGLPSGEYEIPVVIQDKRFDEQNQLAYSATMHDRMVGHYGDQILVNGLPHAEFEVASRAYRLRFLNGSTARIYKLGWSDGTPITVIGVDGGLLETPETRPYVMLAPGERLDVWADFSGRAKGTELSLRSLVFKGVLPKMAEQMMQGGMGQGMKAGGMGGMGGMQHGEGGMGGMGGMGHGMMGGMMASMKLPVGSDFPIFKVRVTREASDSPKLPMRLSTINRYKLSDVANPEKPVLIGISEAPGKMLLNGRPYAYHDVQPGERIPVNTIQLMQIYHAHGSAGGHGSEVTPGAQDGNKGSDMAGHSMAGSEAREGQAASSESMAGMQHGGNAQGDSGMQGMGHGMMGGGMSGMQGMGHGMMGGGGMQGMGQGMKGGSMGGMQHGQSSPQATDSGSSMPHGGGQGAAAGDGMDGMMGGMGMMFSMAHPIHLHGQQFQIISRTIGAEEAEAYATVKDGLIDSGWKDTVLLMPGEKIRIIKPFQDFKGLFMYHCHNLEHEDMGMMREFEVY